MKNTLVLEEMLTAKVSELLTANGIVFERCDVTLKGLRHNLSYSMVSVRRHDSEITLKVDTRSRGGGFRRTINHPSADTDHTAVEAVEVLETFYKVAKVSEEIFGWMETDLKAVIPTEKDDDD